MSLPPHDNTYAYPFADFGDLSFSRGYYDLQENSEGFRLQYHTSGSWQDLGSWKRGPYFSSFTLPTSGRLTFRLV